MGLRDGVDGKGQEMHIGDITVFEPDGQPVLLGDVITVPTIVVLVRYFG